MLIYYCDRLFSLPTARFSNKIAGRVNWHVLLYFAFVIIVEFLNAVFVNAESAAAESVTVESAAAESGIAEAAY